MEIVETGSGRAEKKEYKWGEVRSGEKKIDGRQQRVLLREISPISLHSLETFHLVKTEIWFQGSAGNLWLSKKKHSNFPIALSPLSLSPTTAG